MSSGDYTSRIHLQSASRVLTHHGNNIVFRETKHLVLFTETLAVGEAIPRHKHPGSEEILILQSGRSRVHLGDTVREVGAGATVFIPEDTWISAEVVSNGTRKLDCHFSSLDALTFTNLLRQAQHGDRRAQTRVGVAFAKGEIAGPNPAEAVRWFSGAAEAGDPHAQHDLAMMLFLGEGVERNLPLAAKWFEAAAAAGVQQAQFRAGTMYENGDGVPKNYGRALALLQQSAEQGLAVAQTNLGKMYEKGEGVARDDLVAMRWFEKSAERGMPSENLTSG